jgi:hypothetical protein
VMIRQETAAYQDSYSYSEEEGKEKAHAAAVIIEAASVAIARGWGGVVARAFHKDDEPADCQGLLLTKCMTAGRYAKNCMETDRRLADFKT